MRLNCIWGAPVEYRTIGEPTMRDSVVILCPGQGAQAAGMGRAWMEASPAAAAVFRSADDVLGESLGAPLSTICAQGPAERLNQTDVSQPAIFTCSIACYHGLIEAHGERGPQTHSMAFGEGPPNRDSSAIGNPDPLPIAATAGLSLGEYTALHLAGAFDFESGLKLVATRGRLMQDAAEASDGGMVALIGGDESHATEVCSRAAQGEVLVPANFNAPGQIVLSGTAGACRRAADVAGEMGLKAASLAVAGAFHSPLMQSAADGMRKALEGTPIKPLRLLAWSNVTGMRHDPADLELLRLRLVQQIVRPVRWAQSCGDLIAAGYDTFHELAPGSVLRGLMRRIDRNGKVTSHDEPE